MGDLSSVKAAISQILQASNGGWPIESRDVSDGVSGGCRCDAEGLGILHQHMHKTTQLVLQSAVSNSLHSIHDVRRTTI